MIPAEMIERARTVAIEAAVADRGVKLRRIGRELVGPCPVCGGSDRFVITPKRGLWLCRQCAKGGDVIALQQHIDGLSFAQAVGILAGAEHSTSARRPAQDRRTTGPDLRKPERQASVRSTGVPDDITMLARADAIWRAAGPIAGTDGERYLIGRGIALDQAPDHGGLRFHPACPYDGRNTTPAIIARFSDIISNAPRGIHRRAIVGGKTPKTMSLGPVGGAVVRLWPNEDVADGLVIGEGIETVLAAATRIEHRGTLLRPAWACGTAGNLEDFPVLPGIEALTILADNDASGRGQEAAHRCADRWADAGREVTILTPRDLGDMNDIVRRATA
jgi:phage/plasmid primase-like uncharacterized protein